MNRFTLPVCAGILAFATAHGTLSSSAAAAEPTIAWQQDFASGWSLSKQTGRPMVIYITSDQCRYCDLMKRNTWSAPQIAKRISGSFVGIRLNPRDHADVLARIKVPAYPMTLVALPEGKVIDHVVGYRTPAELQSLMNKVDRQRLAHR